MKFDDANYMSHRWEPGPSQEEGQILSSVAEGLALPPNPLPDRKTAEYLVKAYFEYANFSLPLLHEPTFYRKFDRLYSKASAEPTDTGAEQKDRDQKLAAYFVNMVFAVGLLALQKHNFSEIPTLLCERYYQTALKALPEHGFPDNVEGVQAILLLAKYSYLHPTDIGGWNIIGLALRRAVELGLHIDPPTGSADPLALDTMRRTFWVAYSMDRNVAIMLKRPTGLSDGFITTQVCPLSVTVRLRH